MLQVQCSFQLLSAECQALSKEPSVKLRVSNSKCKISRMSHTSKSFFPWEKTMIVRKGHKSSIVSGLPLSLECRRCELIYKQEGIPKVSVSCFPLKHLQLDIKIMPLSLPVAAFRNRDQKFVNTSLAVYKTSARNDERQA